MRRRAFRWPRIAPAHSNAPSSRFLVQVLWMAAIWAASVAAVLAIAGVLRLALA